MGVIFFTTDGSITETNDAFLQMSGYSKQDVEQGLMRWDIMTPPEWMPASLCAIEEFETTGREPSLRKGIPSQGWLALVGIVRCNATQ
ncbi:PAS domain-containing protein [Microcoleus sp. Aus8_D3]|uniref:PAS domain-containing protein n=1 Tax=unclassified Microcoleus TaxID=2642155 RepID=UPI0034DD28A1